MRNFLLLSAGVLLAGSAVAVEPTTLDSFQAMKVSANGRYVVNEYFGSVEIYDVETGNKVSFVGDEYDNPYIVGQGNSITADGSVLVGYSAETNGGGYVKGGEWHPLKAGDEVLDKSANGISADGLRICGTVSVAPLTTDEAATPMSVPVYWELGSDGEYGDPVMLPYPKYDFTGRVPQYVTAMCISNNGKVIAGQVRDFGGFFCYSITYTQDSDGKWSYTTMADKYLNPEGLEFPEWPGEMDESEPNLEDFLTEEEIAAYEAALQAWTEECEATENWDYDTYPNIEDYLSEETIAAYESALAAYQVKYEAWNEKFNAFQEVYTKCVDGGFPQTYNIVHLNGDGTHALYQYEKSYEDPEAWGGFASNVAPMVFDLSTGAATIYPITENVSASALANDLTVMGYVNDMQSGAWQAKVYLPGTETAISLTDYMKTRNQETAKYMEENLYHDVESFDMDTYEPITLEGVDCTGLPLCTPDQSLVVTRCPNVFDFTSTGLMFSYILPVSDNSRVADRLADGISLKAMRNGVILVAGQIDRVVIYDLNGRTLVDCTPEAGRIDTGLSHGTYIVKAISTEGTQVLKATL